MIPVVEALSIIYIAPVLTMCLAAIILGTIQETLFPFYHNLLQGINLILQSFFLDLFSSLWSYSFANLSFCSHLKPLKVKMIAATISLDLVWHLSLV